MRKLPASVVCGVVLLGAVLAAPLAPVSADDAAVEFKTATLAPEGSTWMNVLTELDQDVRAKTGGRVGFKFYPGGVTGDEKLVIKKMRIGQLQAAGLTNMGLSELVPESRILDIPYLYRSEEETDRVRKALVPRFEQALEKAGYVCLGWADAGTIFLFSTQPIRSIPDLQARKVWVWEGDQIAETTFRTTGVTPIPLAFPDVLTSLQTGLIDTVYISAVGAIAMQWFTKVHYMTEMPIVDELIVLPVQKKAFDKLSPDDQKVVRELGAHHCHRLLEAARKDNLDSIKVLKDKGIEVVAPDAATRAEFDNIAARVSQDLVGKIYDQGLLDEVKKILAEARGGGK